MTDLYVEYPYDAAVTYDGRLVSRSGDGSDLADYQFSYNGLTFDGTTDNAAPYRLLNFSGLERQMRSQDQDRPLGHGSVFGTDYMGGRTIVLEMLIQTTPLLLQAAIDDLSKCWAPITNLGRLNMKLPGKNARFVKGRPRRFGVNAERWGKGWAKAAMEFVCPTPYIFGDEHTGATMAMQPLVNGMTFTADTYPTHPGAGGLTFTADTYPPEPGAGGLDFTPAINTGALMLTNYGGYAAPWEMTVRGPITTPTILHVESGQEIVFAESLAEGEILYLASEDHTVTMGGANRYSFLSKAEWFDLNPGVNTIRIISGGDVGEPGTATITFHDTYIS